MTVNAQKCINSSGYRRALNIRNVLLVNGLEYIGDIGTVFAQPMALSQSITEIMALNGRQYRYESEQRPTIEPWH